MVKPKRKSERKAKKTTFTKYTNTDTTPIIIPSLDNEDDMWQTPMKKQKIKEGITDKVGTGKKKATANENMAASKKKETKEENMAASKKKETKEDKAKSSKKRGRGEDRLSPKKKVVKPKRKNEKAKKSDKVETSKKKGAEKGKSAVKTPLFQALRTRSTPKQLYRAISNLRPKQREAVKKMEKFL